MSEALTVRTPEEVVSAVALRGNLAGLTLVEQWGYYKQFCHALGLDPVVRPFDLITTREGQDTKTVLYPNQMCAALLGKQHAVSYPEIKTEITENIFIYRVKAELGGRVRWGTGAVPIDGLKGAGLANAIKKAETQAHRRATLAICGLAGPDESEVEDIPGAVTQPAAVIANGSEKIQEAEWPCGGWQAELIEVCERLKACGVKGADIRAELKSMTGKEQLSVLTAPEAQKVVEAFTVWADKLERKSALT